ncbi:MAG: division/cell wall cluster transcriptional repressor MraZ [Elusimicrobiota bacterium]|nr:division/cell wall cluster transcriptional repressor MraZ [Elusimicrobiota bacterium]
MIFKGEFRHTLDKKNRLFLPSKFRRGVKNFIITGGLDNCLYVYIFSEWKKIVNKFDSLQIEDKSSLRAFKRAFLSSASDIEVDALGRILIPQKLKQEAQITRKVVIVGVWNRIEIWSEKNWIKYSTRAKKIFKTITQELEI